MELSDYTSLFKLFGIFAFAYVGFDSFHSTISTKIFQSSKRLEDCVRDLYGDFESIRNKFEKSEDFLDSVNHLETKEFFKNKFEQFSSIQQKFEKDKKDIDEKILAWKETFRFTQINLFSALYCVCALYLAGYLESASYPNGLLFLFFLISVFHIIVAIVYSLNDTREPNNDLIFRNLYVIHFWIGAIVVIFVINHIFYPLFPNISDGSQFKNIAILFIIFAPISHYLSYFFRFLVVQNKSEKLTKSLVNDYNEEIQEIDKAFDILTDIVKQKLKK